MRKKFISTNSQITFKLLERTSHCNNFTFPSLFFSMKPCVMVWWHFIMLGNITGSVLRNTHPLGEATSSESVAKLKKKIIKSRSTKWQMVKFQQLKRSKTLWAFNEWSMPWERDLLSINPSLASLIEPSNTVSEYVDTRLQHFLIIFNSRHIFPFNWHPEMPLQSYQIGTKFSRDITTHFWLLAHLIEMISMKLSFLKCGKDSRFSP